MERYDIAIIGTGPAGLSAAVTAAIRKKKILLAGSRDLSSKVQKAQEIQNYLGFPDISGAELGKAFEEHIDRMQVPIVEDRVNLIYPMGDYFSLQVGQDICEADAVILATGVNFGKPFPGEEEFLGRETNCGDGQKKRSRKTGRIYYIFGRGFVGTYRASPQRYTGVLFERFSATERFKVYRCGGTGLSYQCV